MKIQKKEEVKGKCSFLSFFMLSVLFLLYQKDGASMSPAADNFVLNLNHHDIKAVNFLENSV